ncbi:MAG: Signal transduction histidine kinase, partial [uncultured Thiotrichaceae bacterium]
MLRYSFIILLTFFCLANKTLASSPPSGVILTGQADMLSLSPYLEVLEDSGRSLSIEQVTSSAHTQQFYPNTQAIPNFGRTRSAYWIRFKLENRSEQKWYARINALSGHDVALYVLDSAGEEVTGRVAQYMPRYGLHAWSLTLPEQEPLQFYWRATNGDSIFSLPVELFTADAFVEQTRVDSTLYASIIAALLIIAAYNLLSFLLLREKSYLTLTVHIVSIAAIIQFNHSVYNGLGFLKDTDAHFFTAPIYIAAISLLIFCRQLLQLPQKTPRVDRVLRWTAYLSIILMCVTGWIPGGTFLPSLTALFTFALIIIASFIRSLQGYRIAQYFLLIFMLVILIVIPNALINVFDETHWQSAKFYSTGIATSLFLLLLSVVQAEKVRELREQKQRAIVNREATNNFLMTISHELRTPMHIMAGIGEMLRNTPLDRTQTDYLHKFETASRHMLSLVNDILDLGSISQGEMAFKRDNEPFELQQLLDELGRLFSISVKQKGLTLVLPDIDPSVPVFFGDAKRL